MGLVICVVFLLFYLLLFGQNTVYWIGWVIFGIAVIGSLPLCYLSVKYPLLGNIISGLLAGVALSMVLQTAVIYMINYQYSVYITIGVISLITVGLSIVFSDHAIDVANSITSSYVIMRSIGLLLEYPYEFVIFYER